jgi:hypothetical protein
MYGKNVFSTAVRISTFAFVSHFISSSLAAAQCELIHDLFFSLP